MTKEKRKNIVDFDTIMAKKGLIESAPNPFNSDLFGGDIVVENTHPESLVDILSNGGGDDEIYMYSKLIYENCPVFRDPRFLEEYEVDDPYSLPKAVYGSKVVELLRLGNYILSVYGCDTGKIKKVKK